MRTRKTLFAVCCILLFVSWNNNVREVPLQQINNSQRSIEPFASVKTETFQSFLDHFLKTFYIGKNFDSLLSNSTAEMNKIVKSEIGLYVYYNPGAYCTLFGDTHVLEGSEKQDITRLLVLKYFPDKVPDGNYCDGFTSPDGIYYNTVKRLPVYFDMEKDAAAKVEFPAAYKNVKLREVKILYEHALFDTLYFAFADGKWWLVAIYRCDCSA